MYINLFFILYVFKHMPLNMAVCLLWVTSAHFLVNTAQSDGAKRGHLVPYEVELHSKR